MRQQMMNEKVLRKNDVKFTIDSHDNKFSPFKTDYSVFACNFVYTTG